MNESNVTVKALVVENVKLLREAIVFGLESHGIVTYEASGGVEALKIVEANPEINVIISDVRMPEGGGIDLLRNLRTRNYQKPPVILVSAYSDLTPAEAYDLGAKEFMTKPFIEKHLVEMVKYFADPENTSYKPQQEIKVVNTLETTLRSFDDLAFGQDGIFIPIAERFPRINDVVTFTINFTDPKPMSNFCFNGVVKWVRPMRENDLLSGIGVRFISFAKDSVKKVIKTKIDHNKTIAVIPIGRK